MTRMHDYLLTLPLNEFVVVTTYYKGHKSKQRNELPSTYIVHKTHLERFVEAKKNLHENPKPNASGGKPSQLYEIFVSRYRADGPYWWSVPDLKNNDDPNGAVIISEAGRCLLWRHPDYQAILDAEEDEMLRIEREG